LYCRSFRDVIPYNGSDFPNLRRKPVRLTLRDRDFIDLSVPWRLAFRQTRRERERVDDCARQETHRARLGLDQTERARLGHLTVDDHITDDDVGSTLRPKPTLTLRSRKYRLATL